MEYGMFKRQTGEHYECSNEAEALEVWANAPRTEGTWVLMIDGIAVAEAEKLSDDENDSRWRARYSLENYYAAKQ
jgi:hypothetical protein